MKTHEITTDNSQRNHTPRADGIGAYRWCPACDGFTCEQLSPGRFTVCRSCHGSGLDGLLGDREPGTVLRDSRNGGEQYKGDRSGEALRGKPRRKAA